MRLSDAHYKLDSIVELDDAFCLLVFGAYLMSNINCDKGFCSFVKVKYKENL